MRGGRDAKVLIAKPKSALSRGSLSQMSLKIGRCGKVEEEEVRGHPASISGNQRPPSYKTPR